MLYEIELNKHRQSYHLLASVKALIQNQLDNIEKRIVSFHLLQELINPGTDISKNCSRSTVETVYYQNEKFKVNSKDNTTISMDVDQASLLLTWNRYFLTEYMPEPVPNGRIKSLYIR